jgi:hypothetical protein
MGCCASTGNGRGLAWQAGQFDVLPPVRVHTDPALEDLITPETTNVLSAPPQERPEELAEMFQAFAQARRRRRRANRFRDASQSRNRIGSATRTSGSTCQETTGTVNTPLTPRGAAPFASSAKRSSRPATLPPAPYSEQPSPRKSSELAAAPDHGFASFSNTNTYYNSSDIDLGHPSTVAETRPPRLPSMDRDGKLSSIGLNFASDVSRYDGDTNPEDSPEFEAEFGAFMRQWQITVDALHLEADDLRGPESVGDVAAQPSTDATSKRDRRIVKRAAETYNINDDPDQFTPFQEPLSALAVSARRSRRWLYSLPEYPLVFDPRGGGGSSSHDGNVSSLNISATAAASMIEQPGGMDSTVQFEPAANSAASHEATVGGIRPRHASSSG